MEAHVFGYTRRPHAPSPASQAERESGLACPTKDVYLAGWLKPSKMLLAVVNWGDQAVADVRLDLKKLGLPPACSAWDAEQPETRLAVGGDGRMSVPVERHDFRLVVVERQ